MANTLTQIGIETGNIVEAYHISQSIDAFTGIEAYDISLSGSFNMTGPINGEPGLVNPLTASYAITSSTSLTSLSTQRSIINGVTNNQFYQLIFTNENATGNLSIFTNPNNSSLKYNPGIQTFKMTGSFTINGSLSVSQLISISPTNPLPSVTNGSIAFSSSGDFYFGSGSTWNKLTL